VVAPPPIGLSKFFFSASRLFTYEENSIKINNFVVATILVFSEKTGTLWLIAKTKRVQFIMCIADKFRRG